MAEEMQNKKRRAPSSQAHLPIVEIREDVVVLRGGLLRAVLLVSSVNFDLKSEEEQNATIGSYVSFLNSLQHPIQIVVQSRQLQVDDYLEQIRERRALQTNELLRVQTQVYEEFITELVEVSNITSKRYFVVVPYDPIADMSQSFFGRLRQTLWPASGVRLRRAEFLRRKEKLDKRITQIEAGIINMGLQVTRLDTQALIELYYNSFNPVIARHQPLPPLEKLDIS